MNKSLILAVLLVAGVHQQVRSQPVLNVVEGLSFNLGDVREGVVVNRTLTLRNLGDDTLKIKEVSTSCGCTVAKLQTSSLVPGQSAPLRVTLDTKGMRGPFRKEVYIESNDPVTARQVVRYSATVRTTIEFDPSYLNFGKIPLGHTVERTVRIRNSTGSSIGITSIATDRKELNVVLSGKTIPAKGEILLTGRFTASDSGKTVGQIKFITSDTKIGEIGLSYIVFGE